jgi:hypothetical protein
MALGSPLLLETRIALIGPSLPDHSHPHFLPTRVPGYPSAKSSTRKGNLIDHLDPIIVNPTSYPRFDNTWQSFFVALALLDLLDQSYRRIHSAIISWPAICKLQPTALSSILELLDPRVKGVRGDEFDCA